RGLPDPIKSVESSRGVLVLLNVVVVELIPCRYADRIDSLLMLYPIALILMRAWCLPPVGTVLRRKERLHLLAQGRLDAKSSEACTKIRPNFLQSPFAARKRVKPYPVQPPHRVPPRSLPRHEMGGTNSSP